jgi:hypothetical protein
MRRLRTTLAATLVVAGLALAGCAPEADPQPQPTTGETTPPPVPTEAPQPSESPGAEADPTCETIIPATTVDEFVNIGWKPIEEPFVLSSSTELTGGLICKWGDPEVPSDHVQIYGWAPITPTEANTAQLELVANGWRREDAPEGVYITESAETATGTDDQGYGWTYLFGEGWVKFSDTKQTLILIEWPVA